MDKRKSIKSEMKLLRTLSLMSNPPDDLDYKMKTKNLMQWALKISANSLYGSLAFKEYNTYSPRCGMSVTAIGRWALHVSIAVV